MSVQLKVSKNTALKETTVTAYTAAGEFICNGTWTGLTASVAVKLGQQVKADAERILRAEQRRPAYGITSLPAMQVRALLG